MSKSEKTIDVKVERVIEAAPSKVYAAWLNPKVKGTPWNMGEMILMTPKVNGFFYWRVHGTPHYGRFIKLDRSRRIQHTWMSPYTEGQETTVTVTFTKKGANTVMTLVHADLPDNAKGKAHIEGWNQFMDSFPQYFKKKKK